MSLMSLFFFWIFGLLTGVALGAHNPWFAVLGILSLALSFVIMPKRRREIDSAPESGE